MTDIELLQALEIIDNISDDALKYFEKECKDLKLGSYVRKAITNRYRARLNDIEVKFEKTWKDTW